MSQSKQCASCKHYSGAHTCDAFFEGIPIEIMTGMVSHSKPYVDDNETRFELAEEYKMIKDAVVAINNVGT